MPLMSSWFQSDLRESCYTMLFCEHSNLIGAWWLGTLVQPVSTSLLGTGCCQPSWVVF